MFSFIVGSRITRAPYDLAEHFERNGDYFTDHQIKDARDRRVVYQWRFARSKRDNKNSNAMIAKAEEIASGQAPFSMARFLKITGETKGLNQETVGQSPAAGRPEGLCRRRGYAEVGITGVPPHQGRHRGSPDHRPRCAGRRP